jgi:hypothetical protein
MGTHPAQPSQCPHCLPTGPGKLLAATPRGRSISTWAPAGAGPKAFCEGPGKEAQGLGNQLSESGSLEPSAGVRTGETKLAVRVETGPPPRCMQPAQGETQAAGSLQVSMMLCLRTPAGSYW